MEQHCGWYNCCHINAKEVGCIISELAKKTQDIKGFGSCRSSSFIISHRLRPRAVLAQWYGHQACSQHVSVVHYRDIDGNKTSTLEIDGGIMQSAQLILGCDNKACNQDCLWVLTILQLRRLQSDQLNKQKHTYVHKSMRILDLIAFSFLRQFSQYGIHHSPPENGIGRRLEGTRRRKSFHRNSSPMHQACQKAMLAQFSLSTPS